MKTKILLKARWLLCGLLAVFLTTNVWAANETCTLTSAQIKAGSGGTSYGNAIATDGCDNTWNAYAIKNQHSNATSDYHFWQIKKYASNTAYYIQVPTMPGNISSLTITVSNSSKARGGGGNTATLYFSNSNSTSSAGTGVASGTGASSVTIDCSSLNLKSGYITASGAVRIWDVEVTYDAGGAVIPVESVELNESSITLEVDETQTLEATVTPDGATNKNVTWESSDETVATISNAGLVTAIGAGDATITCKSVADNTKQATCAVHVNASPYTKSTLTFSEKCNGSGTADDNVAWTVTSDGSESTFDSSRGIHYGTNSTNVQYIKLSTNGILGTIKRVVVNASAASDVTATASVTVGGAAFGGEAQAISTIATDYTFTGSAIGEIVVTVTKESSATKALYVKSIVVLYETTPTVTVDHASLTFAAKQNIAVEAQQFTLTGANLESELTLTASEGFAVNPTTLTAEAAEEGMSVVVTPATPTEATTPVNGTVTITGGGMTSDVVVNLTMNVTATYAVAVGVNDANMGSATINDGTATVYAEYADEVTLVATANTGYEFVNWTVSDDDIDLGEDAAKANGAVAVIGAAGTITANFQAQSCSVLAAPVLDGAIATTYNSATINWAAVANADGYNVEVKLGDVVKGSDVILEAPLSFTVNNLEANTTYNYTIQTVGDGTTYCEESGVLAGTFTTPDYPTVAVTYSENGNEVSGGNKQIMTAFALPTEVSNTCSKQFVGWTTVDYKNYSDATNAPEVFYAPGAEYTITENADVTLYAVYATVGAGETSTQTLTISGKTTASSYASNSFTDNKNATWSGYCNVPNATHFGLRNDNSKEENVYLGSPVFANNVIGVKATISNNSTSARTAFLCSNNSTNHPTSGDLGSATATAKSGSDALEDEYSFTLTNNASFNQFFLYVSGALTFHEIVVTLAGEPSYSNYATTCTEQVATPTFGVEAGTYYEGKTVTLTCATEDATIYYTTDGSTPSNTNGTEYTAAISLNERAITTIKAIAVKAGMDNSEVTEAEYNINLPYTFTEFAALEKENNKEYAVMGIVSSKNTSLNGSNLTYAISADGTTTGEISCYRGLKLNKAAFESVNDINLGDNVTVVGTWSTQYSNLNANNWMLTYTARVHQSYAIAGELTNSAFNVGDAFDATILNNLYVVETFTNGYSKTVDGATFNAGDKTTWAAGETTLTVYAKLGDEVLTNKDFAVTVSDATLVSIALKADDETYQTKTSYYEGQTLVLPTIVATLSDNNTIEAEATYVSGFDNTTAGVQTVTVSFERGGITKTTTYNVTVIRVFNNEDAPHTVADAKAMIEASAYQQKTSSTDYMWVRGIVVSVPNSSSTYTISDDGTSTDVITVWQGKYFSSSVNAYNHVKAGDKVILKGTIVNYDGTKPELTSSQVIYQLRKAWLNVDNVDNFEVGTADLAAADLTIDTESTGEISFASEDETVVTIVEGKLHAVAPGTVTVTANMAATANDAALNYAAVSTTFNVTVVGTLPRYAVTFDANSGEGNAPVMEAQLEGATFNLPANTFTYTGFQFAGWNDGTNTYGAGAEYTMPAQAVTFTAQWETVCAWATVYTSNVVFTGSGDSYEANSKVNIDDVDYKAQKVGSGGNNAKTGSVTVTVPAGTHTLHFHAAAWNSASSMTIAASGVNNMSVSSFAIAADAGVNNSGTYTLAGDPIDQHFHFTFDAVADETTITFSKTAGTDNRFVMYGINQEGGPELQSITIGGNATNTEYVYGQTFDPAGLTVSAVYRVSGVDQESVDVTDRVVWTFDPAEFNSTSQTSVTATATFETKSASKTVNVTVSEPATPNVTYTAIVVKNNDGNYYAMSQNSTTGTGRFDAVLLDGVIDGKMINVVAATRSEITWIKTETDYGVTFQAQNGKYLTGGTSTTLSLGTDPFYWTWNDEYNCYANSDHGFYMYDNNTYFRNYALSNFRSNASKCSTPGTFLSEYIDIDLTDKEFVTLRSGLENGKIGTICWNADIYEVEGAVFYSPEMKMDCGVNFIEASKEGGVYPMGKPYVFQAEGEEIRALVGTTTTTTAGTNEGLHGVLGEDYIADGEGYYIFYGNKLRTAVNNRVQVNRAYIVIDELPAVSADPAPGRRRLVMGRDDMPTGVEAVVLDAEQVQKVLIDGQIYIVRDGKMYDVTGQQVR